METAVPQTDLADVTAEESVDSVLTFAGRVNWYGTNQSDDTRIPESARRVASYPDRHSSLHKRFGNFGNATSSERRRGSSNFTSVENKRDELQASSPDNLNRTSLEIGLCDYIDQGEAVPMTDEEYAKWLQDQIHAEESCCSAGGIRSAYNSEFGPVVATSRNRTRGRQVQPLAEDNNHSPVQYSGSRARLTRARLHSQRDEHHYETAVSRRRHHLYPRNLDFERDNYDALLELEDAIGEVKSRALPEYVLARLPVVSYKATHTSDGHAHKECQICMSQYEQGDSQRLLPCFHAFHLHCIDRWFEMQSTCPICRKSSVPDGSGHLC